jgi:hypothetical protein
VWRSYIDIFVSNPSCTSHFLAERDKEIQSWLEKHYNCELHLIWRDDQLDRLFEANFEFNRELNVYRRKQQSEVT